MEFVLINASGKEIDWLEPYVSHKFHGTSVFVNNSYHTYELSLEDGNTFIIRESESDEE